jgi:hypothetical protein
MWTGGLLFTLGVLCAAPPDAGSTAGMLDPQERGEPSAPDAGPRGPPPSPPGTHPILPIRSTPPELQEAADRATHLGREIQAQDEVSARAADLLVARVPASQRKPGRGWITISGPWWKVLFLTGDGESLRVAYEASFPRDELPASSRPTLQTLDPPRPLEPDEAVRWKALQTVIQAPPRTCGGPVNPVILPASEIGRSGWLVYLLAATKDAGVQIIGGHQRYWVSADGASVEEHLDLSQCMTELQKQLPAKAVPVGLLLTTPFFEVPNEGHVFTALSNRSDIFLGTFKKGPLWWNVRADGSLEYIGRIQRPDAGR